MQQPPQTAQQSENQMAGNGNSKPPRRRNRKGRVALRPVPAGAEPDAARRVCLVVFQCQRRIVHDSEARLSREQAYILLNDIIRDVLSDDTITVGDATCAADVPGWDSLAHIAVLAAAEIRFGVEIRAADVEPLTTVGDLVDVILRKVPRLPVA